MEYISAITVQGAGPGVIETYVCSRCRVRCNRETSFYYDDDRAASAPETGTARRHCTLHNAPCGYGGHCKDCPEMNR